MSSTPSSKSLTSNEPDYKALLDAVLNTIHRDGGQYTTIAGYQTSVDEAVTVVKGLRKKLSSMMLFKRHT